MALRVLLADESATIKKVIQLALQEFAVEVKSVPVGTDVLSVSQEFRPDIVFIDILLTKKNGYEVCIELKQNPSTKNIPIVIMWSGFMELDPVKLQTANPDGKIEKPFEPETLRSLVRDLVPATNENIITNYLSFPILPEIQEEPPPQKPAERAPTPPPPPSPSKQDLGFKPLDLPVVDELEEPEEFEQVSLKPAGIKKDNLPPAPPPESWERQDITNLKIELPQSVFAATSNTEDDKEPLINLTNSKIALSSGAEEISLEDIEEFSPSLKKTGGKAHLSDSDAEALIRTQVREVLENIAWKILPDMAERIIREELQKLLKDAER